MIVCIIILLIVIVVIFRVDSNAKQQSTQPNPINPSFSFEDVYMNAMRMVEQRKLQWKLANKEAVEEFERNRKKYVAMYVDQAITKYGSKEAAYEAMCPRDDYIICLRDVRLTKEEEIERYRFNECRQEIIDELKKGI